VNGSNQEEENLEKSVVMAPAIKGMVLAAVVQLLAVIAACCQSPTLQLQASDPAALLSDKISRLGETQKEVRLLILKRFGRYRDNSDIYAAVIRAGDDKHICIIEPTERSVGSAPSRRTGAYTIPIEAVVPRDESVDLDPQGFDADGDGYPEVFIRFEDPAADRLIVSFLLFSRNGGSWKVFGSPEIQPDEEMKKAILFGGEMHFIQVNDFGDWLVLDRPDGKKFLSIRTLREGQCTMCPHRYRAVMYRFTPAGFEQDPAWNGGKPFVSDKPMDYPDKSTLNVWIENGYGRHRPADAD
jgi:hypothetical protein